MTNRKEGLFCGLSLWAIGFVLACTLPDTPVGDMWSTVCLIVFFFAGVVIFDENYRRKNYD